MSYPPDDDRWPLVACVLVWLIAAAGMWIFIVEVSLALIDWIEGR